MIARINFLFIVTLTFFYFESRGQYFNTVSSCNKTHSVAVIKYDSTENDYLSIQDLARINLALPAAEGKIIINVSKKSSLPLKQLKITSHYGTRFHPILKKAMLHNGIDFSAHSDTVYSILPGLVTKAAYSPTLGNYLEIQHGLLTSIYGHLSVILLNDNEISS